MIPSRKRGFVYDDDSDNQNDNTKRFKQKDDDDVSSSAPSSPRRVVSPPPHTPAMAPANHVLSLTPTKKGAKPNMSASSSISLEMLRPHFEKPLAQVAKAFGICVTLLKKICRKHGIARWPHRQITGLRKSIASMEHAIGYFEGARRESYAEQLEKQKSKLAALLEDPTRFGSMGSSDEDGAEPAQEAQAPTKALPSPATQVPAYYPTQSYDYPTHQSSQFISCTPVVTEARPMGIPRPSGPIVPPPQRLFNRLDQTRMQPQPAMSLPPLRNGCQPKLPPISSLIANRW
ncbi:TPA: hypothetical protein N0F65_004908 [Lagenidium giganteum]|uniref:RWP-RK domain-containing protein n=1 Tax=Lagenidium giganteum TaxID=4803 RepID=A0AAV2YY09_9STRA|nr:TPA: hypothetical protein N0F65_004908 [Lagenidium giganteum]